MGLILEPNESKAIIIFLNYHQLSSTGSHKMELFKTVTKSLEKGVIIWKSLFLQHLVKAV